MDDPWVRNDLARHIIMTATGTWRLLDGLAALSYNRTPLTETERFYLSLGDTWLRDGTATLREATAIIMTAVDTWERLEASGLLAGGGLLALKVGREWLATGTGRGAKSGSRVTDREV